MTSSQPNPETQPAPASRLHGRGGAGNITSKPSPNLNPTDLQTPTLKGSHYTTGRGGSGNMAKNDPSNPAESRAAQDVEAPLHHAKEPQGTYHWGRGGEGNMTHVGPKNPPQASNSTTEQNARTTSKDRSKSKSKERTMSNSLGERRPSFQGIVNKGKEILGLKKNGNGSYTGESKASGASSSPLSDEKNESAIE